MLQLRVTKYNPKFRHEDGGYLKDEWTSVSDVGRIYDGKPFNYKEYLRIEDAYVAVINRFLSSQNIKSMVISYYESGNGDDHVPTVIKIQRPVGQKKLKRGSRLSKRFISLCARRVLRETCWCKLESDRGAFIHFGWDYYMYFGCSKSVPLNQLSTEDTYLEERMSPYFMPETSPRRIWIK